MIVDTRPNERLRDVRNVMDRLQYLAPRRAAKMLERYGLAGAIVRLSDGSRGHHSGDQRNAPSKAAINAAARQTLFTLKTAALNRRLHLRLVALMRSEVRAHPVADELSIER